MGRLVYLDNLKVVLIAAIIALHGVASYAGTLEVWTYTEMREVTLTPAAEITLVLLALPIGLILIALLFLVAGLLTVPSMDRKGPGRFARDRLIRLGIPFAVYVLLIQPTVVYALEHPLGYAPGSYWQEFLGDERILDTGPLWFVGVLLIYSLAYAAWVHLRRPATPRQVRAVGVRHLVVAAAVVAPVSFAIRLVYPYGGDAGFTDLNLWQWPACIAVFTLGITAARQGWQVTIPDRLRRTARTVTLVAMAAMAALLIGAGLTERVEDLMGGWQPLAAGFAALDAILCMFGSVWMLAVAQHHLARPVPAGDRACPQRVRGVHPPDTDPDRPGPGPATAGPARRGQGPARRRRRGHRVLRPGLAHRVPSARGEPHPVAVSRCRTPQGCRVRRSRCAAPSGVRPVRTPGHQPQQSRGVTCQSHAMIVEFGPSGVNVSVPCVSSSVLVVSDPSTWGRSNFVSVTNSSIPPRPMIARNRLPAPIGSPVSRLTLRMSGL